MECYGENSNMFGGFSNGHSGFLEEQQQHQSHYDMTSLPQLQLFDKCEFFIYYIFISYFLYDICI